ncbi:Holliday junction branch migration protein RuvA [Candidatus Babeliales bacterium]|nr:Holliday junction branch migration protein RuvA [Candidatus Babeliales bacterium]
MISYIKGHVARVGEQAITILPGIDGKGGLGWEVAVARAHQFSKGSEVELEVVMHWNAEQGPSLYGFSTLLEKQLFCLLVSCSGVGPRLALAVLCAMKPEELIGIVTARDATAMSRVPGIGTRKAEQLIVHMEPKIAALIKSGIAIGGTQATLQRHEVAEALSSLNYSRQEISRAMQHINEQYAEKDLAFDVLLRHALSFLAKRL